MEIEDSHVFHLEQEVKKLQEEKDKQDQDLTIWKKSAAVSFLRVAWVWLDRLVSKQGRIINVNMCYQFCILRNLSERLFWGF